MKLINEFTIIQANDGLKKGEFSSLELTSSCFKTIHEAEKKIGAFITLNEEGALAASKEADRRISAGKALGPLDGIPVAVKDNMLAQGLPCTAGSRMLENYQAVYDATVIAKLKKAGAVIVGKTNMDEFAMGSSTENSAFFKTRNPRNINAVPGGSSGGSAAAVAANECLCALGSDTGGSVRQPASLCGVVGLKPTYGSVSRYGLIAMASSLDVIGPLTKTVADAKIVFQTICGQDSKDATTLTSEIFKFANLQISKLKIGVPKEYFIDGMDLEVEKAVRLAIKKFEKLGAKIIDISLPHAEYGLAVYYILMPAEVSANLARFDGIRYGYSEILNLKSKILNLYEVYAKSRAKGFGDEPKRRIMLGTYALSAGYRDAYYKKAQTVRALVKQDFDKAFAHVDCLLTPTSPTPAWQFGERINDPLTMYLSDIFTVSANLAGIPAISIPCGKAGDLPIGLQIMAPQFGEEILFKAGEAFEKIN